MLEHVRSGTIDGYIAISSIMELVHHIKVQAMIHALDPGPAIEQAVSDISSVGLRQLSADAFTMPHALSFIISHYLDPFDAIMVSIAVSEGMDAVVSRDNKLKKKASNIIPVYTPEEFLSKL